MLRFLVLAAVSLWIISGCSEKIEGDRGTSPEVILDVKAKIHRCALAPDGAYTAVGNWDAITICDVKQKKVVTFNVERTSGLGFAADGSFLAYATVERAKIKSDPLLMSYLILVDPKTGKELTRWRIQQEGYEDNDGLISPIGVLTVSGNGKVIGVGSVNLGATKGMISVYDAKKHKLIGQLETRVSSIVSLCMSDDGNVIYAGTTTHSGEEPAIAGRADLVIWQRDTGATQFLQGHSGDVWAVAVAENHKIIITGGGTEPGWHGSSEMLVWSHSDGKLQQTITRKQACLTSLAVSQDESILASGDGEGTVLLWELPKMKQVGSLSTSKSSSVKAMRFVSDELYVGTADGKVRKYRIKQLKK